MVSTAKQSKTPGKRIILASTSPRRVEVLKNAGLIFDVMPSSYEEDMTLKLPVEKLVRKFAIGKAKAVAKGISSGIVIGADTVCYFNGKVLGKPKSRDDAVRTLLEMSNKWVPAYSGICIIDVATNKMFVDIETSKVKFQRLSRDEVERYVDSGEPLDKAGSFAIQGYGGVFIERVEGCYFNIMGLPLHKVYVGLKKLGVEMSHFWNR